MIRKTDVFGARCRPFALRLDRRCSLSPFSDETEIFDAPCRLFRVKLRSSLLVFRCCRLNRQLRCCLSCVQARPGDLTRVPGLVKGRFRQKQEAAKRKKNNRMQSSAVHGKAFRMNWTSASYVRWNCFASSATFAHRSSEARRPVASSAERVLAWDAHAHGDFEQSYIEVGRTLK